MKTQLSVNELALYLGCEAQAVVPPFHQLDMKGTLTEVSSNDCVNLYSEEEGNVSWNSAYIKPILRPLSDITEEEYFDWGKITKVGMPTYLSAKEKGQIQYLFQECSGYKGTIYLLSKGFDLLNWIEQGLAIRKEPAT